MHRITDLNPLYRKLSNELPSMGIYLGEKGGGVQPNACIPYGNPPMDSAVLLQYRLMDDINPKLK